MGGEGIDYLFGGSGRDTLDGGNGNDIYFYNIGDGLDTINNYDAGIGRFDTIHFGEGIYLGNITASREEYDLTIYINLERALILNNYFGNPYVSGNLNDFQINEIVFSDGYHLVREQLTAMADISYDYSQSLHGDASDNTINGLGGYDDIHGQGGDDFLFGGEGKDSLYGNEGNDSLNGGEGNDVLIGGEGNDSYYYEIGDGVDSIWNSYQGISGGVTDYDRIDFNGDIAAANVFLRQNDGSLEIWVDQALSLTVNNHFQQLEYAINGIHFSDGTVWNETYINSAVLLPSQINDDLYGDESNNVLLGLRGNDTLSGDLGSDIYEFSLGDGNDIIYDFYNDEISVDRILFDETIIQESIDLLRYSNDLVLYNNQSDETITLINYFIFDEQSSKEIVFFDGSTWDDDEIAARVQIGNHFDERLSGLEQDDSIDGREGSDIIYGYGGNDVLIGGEGDDYLFSGAGNDRLVGGFGDDKLDLGNGDNTVIFNYGDGFDVLTNSTSSSTNILALRNILPEDVILHVSRDNKVEIILTDGSGAIVIGDDPNDLSSSHIQEVHFDNGMIWNADVMEDALVQSSPFNNYITGTGNNDVINGLQGDDYLLGGLGDDIYEFSVNDGKDNIYDVGGDNSLLFLNGILPDDVVIWRDVRDDWASRYSLVIAIKGVEQLITIDNFYNQYDSSSSFQIAFVEDPETLLTYQDLLNVSDFSLTSYYNSLYFDSERLDDDSSAEWSGSWDYGVFLSQGDDHVFFDLGSIWAGAGDDILVSAKNTNVSKASHLLEIDGGLGNDEIYAGGADNKIFGGPATIDLDDEYYNSYLDYGGLDFSEFNQSLWKTTEPDGNDFLMGEGGNDLINGGLGDDIIIGGHGNDELSGGGGDDIYVFNIGDGHDRIIVNERSPDVIATWNTHENEADFRDSYDILTFGHSIQPNNMVVLQDGDDLIFQLTHTDDSVRVESFFSYNTALRHAINAVVFSGGITWGLNDIYSQVMPFEDLNVGGINGNPDAESLEGDEGNNVIKAYGGNDVLSGQQGDDYLIGGNGNDIYKFSSGFGTDLIDNYDDTFSVGSGDAFTTQDIIQFDQTIDPEDISLLKDGNDLLLSNGVDSIRVNSHYLGDGLGFNYRYAIDGVRFANGEFWGAAVFHEINDEHINISPIVESDHLYTLENTVLSIESSELLINDFDLDGGVLMIESIENVSNGSAIFNNVTGLITFTPENEFIGMASFDYSVSDGIDFVFGTVRIDVSDSIVNSTPLLRPDTFSFLENTILDIQTDELLLNDSEIDGDEIVILGVNNAIYGEVIFESETSNIRFIPDADFYGQASFDYIASDGFSSSTATVTLDITEDTSLAILGDVNNNILRGGSSDDQIFGLEGDDRLYGREGNDSLYGGEGDDRLNGDAGDDVMAGGRGNDRYYVDSLADVVTELVDEGVADRVYSSVNYSLGEYIEQLVLQGNDNLSATGNSFDNRLYGNGADNLLLGLLGDDRLIGREGNDTLSGGAGRDILNGGAGVDVMTGGTGDDRYYVDNLNDIVIEASDEGMDRIFSFIDYTLSDNVERLYLKGGAAINGFGNEADDYLYGNDAANTLMGLSGRDRLFGRDGNDLLIGGLGNDVLRGEDGSDTYQFSRGDGRDVIEDIDLDDNNNDVLDFTDIASSDLWFRQNGNNLIVDVVGSNDRVTVKNWYSGDSYQIDEIHAGDDVLTRNSVESLVNAMAVFDVPRGVGAVVPQDRQNALDSVLAASWS